MKLLDISGIRRRKKEHLNTKIDELETNRKIENINDFKNGYQSRTNRVTDAKGETELQTDTV